MKVKRFPVYTLSACLVAIVWYFAPEQDLAITDPTRKDPPNGSNGVMEIVDTGQGTHGTNPGESLPNSVGEERKTPPSQGFQHLLEPHDLEGAHFDRWLKGKEDDAGELAKAKVTAGILSENDGLLREGVEMDDENPMLAYVGATDDAFSGEEQLLHSKRFYANDPENALAAFIYATRLFEHGKKEGAFQVLQKSKDRQVLDDYTQESLRLMKEAYQAAEYTELDAQLQSMFQLGKPYLGDLLSFAGELDDVADTLPAQEAKNLRNLASSMGIRVSQSATTGTLLDQLTGLAMEERSLEGIGEGDNSPFEGMTVEEARTSIKGRKDRLKMVMSKFAGMDEVNVLSKDPVLMEGYLEEFWKSGELGAIQWLLLQVGE